MLSGKGSGLLGTSGLPSVISDRETPSRRLGVGGSRGVEGSLDLGLTNRPWWNKRHDRGGEAAVQAVSKTASETLQKTDH